MDEVDLQALEALEATVDPPKFSSAMPADCPLDGALDAHGGVYRLVKTNPPTADDFLSVFELGSDIPAGRACECHGLSLFRDSEDAEAYADKFPHLGEFIAAATLTPELGKIAETPRNFRGTLISHATWWPYEDVQREVPFVVKAIE
ncbi:hypothetical protein [Mesorhizobium sp. LSHC422A00]|uniref:hypothetical protein n=1 Tax=Mesorhizobium sp. LSHC422A00 TaxID=1287294 RepID=UPI0012EB5083|nr:hypothetical protein [Mesorhizobium sp. LSHC422A00]